MDQNELEILYWLAVSSITSECQIYRTRTDCDSVGCDAVDKCDETPFVVGVIDRFCFECISGDSRLDRESIVRGEADGDGIVGGIYGFV